MELDRLEDLQDNETEWSVSRLQTILTCGKRYEYKYISKVAELPTPPLAFGSAVHKCIETLHLTNNWDDGYVQRLWSDEWYVAQQDVDWDNTRYRKTTFETKGPKILEKYISKHKDDQWLGLEINFRLSLSSDLPVFRGMIDKVQRLTENSDVPPEYIGRPAIVDYKTGKNEPDALLLSVDPQLIIYSKAFNKLTGEDPVVGLHHLPSDKIFWKVVGADDFETIVVPMLKRGIQRINNEEWERNVAWSCKFCPYKVPCLSGLSAEPQIR